MIPAMSLISGMSQLSSADMASFRSMNNWSNSLSQFAGMGRMMGQLGNDTFMRSPAFGTMMSAAQGDEMTFMMNRLVHKPLLEARINNAKSDLQKRISMVYG